MARGEQAEVKVQSEGAPAQEPIEAPEPEQFAGFREYRRTGDKRLQQELICHYLPLVSKIARRYVRPGAALEDLSQIGTIGLINAVKTFDPERGVKFETYAFHHVAGEIRHFLRDGLEPVRRPRWVRKRYGDLAAVVARSQQELGRTPTLAEIAERMNMTEDGVAEILQAYHQGRVRSINELPEDQELRHDVAVREPHGSWQALVEDRIVLLQAMDNLAALQRQVVYYLFYQGLTQSEVAVRLGVSQRHVSRLLASALRRLAGPLRAADLDARSVTAS